MTTTLKSIVGKTTLAPADGGPKLVLQSAVFGPRGVSITNVVVRDDEHLIVSLSNGNQIDAGVTYTNPMLPKQPWSIGPDLPGGYVNGNRFIPDGDFDWTQPDATVQHVYAGDTCEVRIDGANVWLDVTYPPASVDKRVAIEAARAEAAEAALAEQLATEAARAEAAEAALAEQSIINALIFGG